MSDQSDQFECPWQGPTKSQLLSTINAFDFDGAKPGCTTVQVVLPAADRGALVEVDVIAVRPE